MTEPDERATGSRFCRRHEFSDMYLWSLPGVRAGVPLCAAGFIYNPYGNGPSMQEAAVAKVSPTAQDGLVGAAVSVFGDRDSAGHPGGRSEVSV